MSEVASGQVGNTPEAVNDPARDATSTKLKRKNEETENMKQQLDDVTIPADAKMESPNVIRSKINRFIESGEMKIGEFHDFLGVSGNAYRRFIRGNGKEGEHSDVYLAAWTFFTKRKILGIKGPKRQKVTPSASVVKATDSSDIKLPGEDTDEVQVYETCDEIRRKIRAYLRKPGVTRAQFCRDIHAQFHTDKAPAQIQSGTLARFMGYNGPGAGNTSSLFYGAYVFFEKLRVKEGKAKSEHRQQMEKEEKAALILLTPVTKLCSLLETTRTRVKMNLAASQFERKICCRTSETTVLHLKQNEL